MQRVRDHATGSAGRGRLRRLDAGAGGCGRAIADGVIVGSAIVKRQADLEGLRAFVTELAEAVHGAS